MTSPVPAFAASPNSLTEGRVFNDDLLNNSGDLAYAQSQFPETFHLLDHPELRLAFETYEKKANEAHACVRWLGLLAVTSGAIALLSAATEVWWHHLKYERVLAIVFELCGLLAAIVAGGSLWLGPWRKRWLESRFMTERLRQWHFQLLVRKGSEIEALLGQRTPEALNTFKVERKKWFESFLHDFTGKLDSKMDSLTNDPDYASDWLHSPTKFSHNSRSVDHVFEMYRRLRFSHQYDYATYKLSASADRSLWQFLNWPLLRQESALRGCGSFCFIAAMLFSVGVIVNRFFEIKPEFAPYLASTTVALAIAGVAIRTILDGLGIKEDIERFRDYRGKVRRLFSSFEEARDQLQKLQVMKEMELTVVDEMRDFLRTHRNAVFRL